MCPSCFSAIDPRTVPAFPLPQISTHLSPPSALSPGPKCPISLKNREMTEEPALEKTLPAAPLHRGPGVVVVAEQLRGDRLGWGYRGRTESGGRAAPAQHRGPSLCRQRACCAPRSLAVPQSRFLPAPVPQLLKRELEIISASPLRVARKMKYTHLYKPRSKRVQGVKSV